MQVLNVMIDDIDVLWLFMHICVLDQDQEDLIVSFELKRWSCLMSLIFSDVHMIWISFKVLAYVHVLQHLSESDSNLCAYWHDHVLNLCDWCDNKLLLAACSWDWFIFKHVHMSQNRSAILFVWCVVWVRVFKHNLTFTELIHYAEIDDWSDVSQ